MKRQRIRELVIYESRPKGFRKKGKKNRKHGRNKKKCEAYLRLGKHIKSHIRRIEEHLKVYGRGDKQAVRALEDFTRALRLAPNSKTRIRR